MEIKKLALSVGLAVAALGWVGTAQAVPMLQIAGSGGGAPDPTNAEAIGDPGGTLYTNGPTPYASSGPGMPTALGGWPTPAPGLAPDPSFNNALGISGYDASYLKLTGLGAGSTNVTFQFMGKGDATNHDVFQLFLGGAWTTIWDNQSRTNGTCGMSGPTTPNCPFPLSSQTFTFAAGDLLAGDYLPFQFLNLSTPGTATNDGTNNPSPDKQGLAGYFLGMDPYLASGPFTDTGRVAYAGFTDLPDGDHDYEDLVVRVSVPEPGSIFLLGGGLLGLAGLRKRKA